MAWKCRMACSEQVVATLFPTYSYANAWQDGRTRHNTKAVIGTDGMQPTVHFPSPQRTGKTVSWNYLQNRNLSSYTHSVMNYHLGNLQDFNPNLCLQLKRYCYEINGCCQTVHKELGPFLNEYMYQDALEIIFNERAIPHTREHYFSVDFHGQQIRHEIDQSQNWHPLQFRSHTRPKRTLLSWHRHQHNVFLLIAPPTNSRYPNGLSPIRTTLDTPNDWSRLIASTHNSRFANVVYLGISPVRTFLD